MAIAAAAAIASPIGGFVALWSKPSTLFMSGALGFASGVLLATITFEMLFLRGLPQPVLGTLFGAGAGGMFYLTVTNLVPEAEKHQYQQFPAIAMGSGFMGIFALATLF